MYWEEFDDLEWETIFSRDEDPYETGDGHEE